MTWRKTPEPSSWIVRGRRREQRTHFDYRGVRRVVKAWTPWRSLKFCSTEEGARAALDELRRLDSLRDLAIFYRGKRLPSGGRSR